MKGLRSKVLNVSRVIIMWQISTLIWRNCVSSNSILHLNGGSVSLSGCHLTFKCISFSAFLSQRNEVLCQVVFYLFKNVTQKALIPLYIYSLICTYINTSISISPDTIYYLIQIQFYIMVQSSGATVNNMSIQAYESLKSVKSLYYGHILYFYIYSFLF